MNKRKTQFVRALCFFLMTLLLFLESAPILAVIADSFNFVLTVTPVVVYENGNAKAGDGESIVLKLTLNRQTNSGEYVNVYYRTYNEDGDNAEGSDDIANYGDYAQTNGAVVTFSPGQIEQTVKIKVHNRNAEILKDGQPVDRIFHFAVTSANCNYGSVTVNGGNVRCQVTKAILVDVSPAEKYANGNAKSTDGKSIAINLSVDKLPAAGNGITVSYHTEDYGGAIGSEDVNMSGDYTITKGKAVFTTEKKISVFVNINPDNPGVLINGSEVNRTFRFVIDGISSSSAEQEAALHSSAVVCQLPSTTLFQATADPNHSGSYFFNDYGTPYAQFVWYEKEVEDEHYEITTNIYKDNLGTFQSWKTKYIDAGLADAYLSLNQMWIEDSDCDNKTQTTISYSTGGDYAFFLETEHTLAPNDKKLIIYSYEFYKIPTNSKLKFQKSFWFGDGPVFNRCVIKDYVTGYLYTVVGGTEFDSSLRTLIKVPHGYEPVYNVKFDNTFSKVINRTFTINMQVYLVDTVAPEVRGVYADDSSVYIDNKFRVSVRFSEPVQVFDPNLSIGVQLGTTEVEMKYLAGAGSDTLTFECDLTAINSSSLRGRYTSATLQRIKGADQIGDFALFNKNNNTTNTKQFCNHLSDGYQGAATATFGEDSTVNRIYGFDIDFRSPLITIDNSLVNPSVETVASVRRFPVTVNNMTSGTISYAFCDSLNSIPEYTQTKNVDNPSGDPFTLYITGENLEGEKYLFVKAVSNLKKETQTVLYKDEDTMESDKHGYYFSNVPPSVGSITTGGTERQTRFFEFDIKTDYLTDTIGSDLYAVYLVRAADRYGAQPQTYCIYASEDNTDARVMAQSELFSRIVTDVSVGNPKEGKHFYVDLSGLSSVIGLENKAGKSAGTFYLGFYAIDSAGNSSFSSITYNPYRFDLSPTFKANVEYLGVSIVTGNHLVSGKTYHATDRVFNLSDSSVIFSLNDLTEASLYVDSVRVGDTTYYYAPTEEIAAAWTQESIDAALAEAAELDAMGKDSSSVTSITYTYWEDSIAELFTASKNVIGDVQDATKQYSYINLTPKGASYYEIVLGRWDGGRKTSADIYSFYVTDGKKEETANYALTDGNFVLNNRLFFLQSNFWYMKADGSFLSENYGGSSDVPVFGTTDAARDYVRAMEEKDLYLVQLTDQQALFLNHPEETNSLIPAEDESTVAKEGQWWIRYKRAEWTEPTEQSGTTAAGNWVYYYYCESGNNPEGVIGSLPTLLVDAIEAVTDIVIKKGTYVNLIGEEYLDERTGEPYVATNRVHADPEFFSETKTGSRLSPAVSYNGDKYVYSNTVSVKGVDYPLAANLRITVNEYTALFVKNENGTYSEIPLKNNSTLRDLIGETTSQIVTLLELDSTGAREYPVYIDTEAPNLRVDYVNIETDTKISATLSAVNDGFNVSGKSIVLRGFENEVDDLAYVVVYDVNTYRVVKVLYASDFVGGYRLADGSYLLEVGDRSGNIYDLSAMICSVPLSVEVKKNEDETALLVYCNREDTEIRRYEIKLNGEIVSSTYSKAASFNKNGVYRVDVVDIFGNSYSDTFVFRRGEPKITWYYSETADSDVILFGGAEDKGNVMVQTVLETGVLQVTTSGYPTFVVNSDIVVNITGAESGADYIIGKGLNTTQYIFLEQKGFVFEAYAPGYETSAAQVMVIMETEAPTFEVTCRAASYTVGETTLNFPYTVKSDGTVVPKSLPYNKKTMNEAPVSNGGIAASDYVRMKITDISALTDVTILYNGERLEQVEREGVYYIFREHGDYQITATDFFGNTSQFSFSSKELSICEYRIDGTAVAARLGTETYGHGNAVVQMNEDGMVYLLVSYEENGEQKSDVYVYRVESEQLLSGTYRYVKHRFYEVLDQTGDDTGTRTFLSLTSSENDSPILRFLLSDPDRTSQAPVILSAKDAPYILTLTEDGQGGVLFTVERKEGVVRVQSRVTVSNQLIEPYANDTLLSGEYSDVTLVYANGTLDTYKDGKPIGTVKTKEVFTVEKPEQGSIITQILYAFSKTDSFDEFVPITFDENGCSFLAKASGFYRIRVINRYGNVTEYTLHRSDSFALVTEAVYADETSSKYSDDYRDTYRSNNKILLRAFGGNDGVVSFFQIKNALEVSLADRIKVSDDGWYTLELSEIGEFHLILRDEFGVEKRVDCSITAPAEPNIEDLVFGFPTGAEHDGKKGYSKDPLSVNFDLAEERHVSYVALSFGNTVTVLKDSLTVMNGIITVDPEAPCIGLSGDGTYTVIFRDRYGNRAEYTVYYHGSDTFYAERTIRSSGEDERISAERIEREYGLFSNNSFTLKTLAERYTLTVNGKTGECPAAFSLSTVSGDYRSEYTVTYTDIYGYSYSFSAYLIRRTLSLALSDSVKVKTVDNVDKTSDVVSVVFEQENVCKTTVVYTLNGGETMPYSVGEKLFDDGLYTFVVSDYAGNETYLAIKRDTVCEYTLTEEGAAKPLLNYGVASGAVRFERKNGDDVEIVKAYCNGELVDDIEGYLMTTGGKWELILKDGIGNTSMFTFTVMTHALARFDYVTPYDYQITAIWQELGEGEGRISRISYLYQVDNETYADRSAFSISDNGKYSVIMKSRYTDEIVTFSFEIDDTPPEAVLVGCNDGETTTETVTVAGCHVGDRIQIYRNSSPVPKYDFVLSYDSEVPEITEGGDYVIVITNEAGVSVTHSFYKKTIANTPGSVFIILMVVLLASGLFAGLILRNTSKVDK